MKEKWFDKAARIGARVLEALYWTVAAALVVLLVVSFVNEAMIGELVEQGIIERSSEVAAYGYRLELTGGTFQNIAAFRLFLMGAVVMLAMMAMIFRNVHLILRNSRQSTPFQPDNLRMLREIGIFCMAQPVAGLAVCVLVPLFAGHEAAGAASVDLGGFLLGAVALSLTRVFARGMELERDTEGLL